MTSSKQSGGREEKVQPPDYVASNVGSFTGIWMGWRWINGKAVEKAPPVER